MNIPIIRQYIYGYYLDIDSVTFPDIIDPNKIIKQQLLEHNADCFCVESINVDSDNHRYYDISKQDKIITVKKSINSLRSNDTICIYRVNGRFFLDVCYSFISRKNLLLISNPNNVTEYREWLTQIANAIEWLKGLIIQHVTESSNSSMEKYGIKLYISTYKFASEPQFIYDEILYYIIQSTVSHTDNSRLETKPCEIPIPVSDKLKYKTSYVISDLLLNDILTRSFGFVSIQSISEDDIVPNLVIEQVNDSFYVTLSTLTNILNKILESCIRDKEYISKWPQNYAQILKTFNWYTSLLISDKFLK